MKVLVSGGFDPLHVGHVRYIQAASQLGDLYVALNSDAWLIRKKGYVFMPFAERREILLSLKRVALVIEVDDRDDTVAAAILDIRPDYFANGGDRMAPNPIEHQACLACNTQQVYGIGGNKIQSSSWLINRRMY